MASSIFLVLIIVILVVRHITSTDYAKIYAQDPNKVKISQVVVDILIDVALWVIAINLLEMAAKDLWAFISAKIS